MVDSYPPLFHRIGIYGVGLLGGSLGMALKSAWPETQIIGIGRSPERLQEAKQLGAIDDFSCDPETIRPFLDLLVICTPVRLVPKQMEQTMPSLADGAVVTDVGSTKATMVPACEACAGERIKFVGSHPMAGSHKTGVKAAFPELFQNKVCVVTRTERTDPTALQKVGGMWKTVGMQVVNLSPRKHDRLTARSSHLPHLIAAALCHVAGAMGSEIHTVMGEGFRDTTRVAAGDPAMWLDICLENRVEISASILNLQQILEKLQQWIDRSDETAILQFLQQAQKWKASF